MWQVRKYRQSWNKTWEWKGNILRKIGQAIACLFMKDMVVCMHGFSVCRVKFEVGIEYILKTLNS